MQGLIPIKLDKAAEKGLDNLGFNAVLIVRKDGECFIQSEVNLKEGIHSDGFRPDYADFKEVYGIELIGPFKLTPQFD